MATQVRSSSTSPALEGMPAPITPRKARPVVWWAAVGGAALTLQLWIYGSWIFSGDVHSVSVGHGRVSSYTASVLAAVGGAKLMERMRARRPRTGALGLVLITWAVLSAAVFVTEDLLIHAGWLAWNGIPAVTPWAHSRLAIPLTEVLGWGIPQTALAALLFFKSDRGQVAVERGIDRVRLSGWRRTLLSTLAVIGFATAAQGVYAVISAPVGLYVGAQANLPSYMRNGVCGSGTPHRCPAPGVPVLLPRGARSGSS